MDRNDRNYFRRPTPEMIESQFDGYDVPENIRKRVALIMKRFCIIGLCDGMYIANCIAYDNGTGDGCGHFQEGEITEVEKIAKFLMGAYSSNIFPCDKETLEDIIANGELQKESMISGLKSAIQIRRNRIDTITDCWRKEFLFGEINVIKDIIQMEAAG